MKHTFIILIIVRLLFTVLPCFGDYTSRASWEEQIHGMGYLILHPWPIWQVFLGKGEC